MGADGRLLSFCHSAQPGGGFVSKLLWKIRRLRAMEAKEIIHRAKCSFRNRFFAPRHEAWSPGEAYDKLFTSSQVRQLTLPLTSSDLTDATRLLNGDWSIFGFPIRLDDPPNWRRNYITGQDWPDLPASSLDYRRNDVAGGVKFAWELGRWTWATSLAHAFHLTGDPTYRDKCLQWMHDFAVKNPIKHGIHHTSGIEDAIRVLAGIWSLGLLKASSDALTNPILGLIAQQAIHCMDNLSIGSSGNNHLLAEYSAMTVAGAALPGLTLGPTLLETGFRGICNETLCQINPDGSSVEQAFGYLPFIWELILLPLMFAELAGKSTPQEVKDRLACSFNFAQTVRLPDGTMPKIGDEDDGCVLLPGCSMSRLDFIGNILQSYVGEMPSVVDGTYIFPEGGYTVWRHKGLLITFDHGPLGYKSIAAHGHADALSFTVFANGTPIVVDPGIYAYQDDYAARDRFRSTPYHSTVNFVGRSQSEILGPFMWGAQARVARQDDGWECTWHTGEKHWRNVLSDNSVVTVLDKVSGEKPESVLVLHPTANVELQRSLAWVSVGEWQARITSTGLNEWRLEPGEYSPRFGHKVPTNRLCAGFDGPSATIEIAIGRAIR